MADIDYSNPLVQATISEGQKRGYGPMALAGILGRMGSESSYNPAAIGDNGISHGAMQWNKDRWQNLQDTAQAAGKPWTDPSVQATHLFDELGDPEQEGTSGAKLKAAKTPTDAANAVMGYVRPQGYTPDTPQAGAGYKDTLNSTNQIAAALTGQNPQALTEGRSVSSTPAANTGVISSPGFGQATPQQAQPQETLGQRLMMLSSALMARDNPSGAAQMAALAKSVGGTQTASKTNQIEDLGVSGSGKYRIERDAAGNYRYTPVPEDAQKPEKVTPEPKEPPIRAQDQQLYQNSGQRADNASRLVENGNLVRQAILDGKLDLSPNEQGWATVKNYLGNSSEESVLLKNALADIDNSAIQLANTEKGSLSNARLQQAKQSVLPAGGRFDSATFLDGLTRMVNASKDIYKNSATTQSAYLKQHPSMAGSIPDADGNVPTPEGINKAFGDRMSSWEKFDKDFSPKADAWRQQHFNKNNPQAQSAPQATPQLTEDEAGYKLWNDAPSGTRFRKPNGKEVIKP